MARDQWLVPNPTKIFISHSIKMVTIPIQFFLVENHHTPSVEIIIPHKLYRIVGWYAGGLNGGRNIFRNYIGIIVYFSNVVLDWNRSHWKFVEACGGVLKVTLPHFLP